MLFHHRTTLRLHYRLPFEGDAILRFLGRRAIPGVEEVEGGRYRRTVALGRSAGTIALEVTPGAEHVLLRVKLDDLSDLNLVVQRCRDLLDLDADPMIISETLAADETLAPLVTRRPGLRVPGAVSGWEVAVRAVLGQQISVVAARTLAGRLVEALGTPIPEPEGGLTHLVPPPEAVAEADLMGLGITGRRVETIRALARALIRREIILDRDADREEMSTRLQRLPGIGPWTVSYIAMRALGDPNAFPAADLGIRQACERLGLDARPRNIEARAERWRPWRAYAAMHLWESLSS